jgi:hypothetical protein
MNGLFGSYDDDDSAVGSTGEFVALQSFSGSGSGDDESIVHIAGIRRKKVPQMKSTMQPIERNRKHEIEANRSTDSDVYNDGSCGACLAELFGWDPDNIVVKVSVSKLGAMNNEDCFDMAHIHSNLLSN